MSWRFAPALLAVAVATQDPAYAAGPGASATAPVAAMRPAPAVGHLGTWVWDEATVLSSDGRRDLLAFARRKQVDLLFVHASAAYEEARGFAALAALVEAAALQSASIMLVAGDPSWALPAHHLDAVAYVQRAARIDARLATRGLARFGRVLFDVEPYLLPAWRTSRERTAAGYGQLLRALQEAGQAASVQVWHTIPFWFRGVTVSGEALEERVLTAADGIVVMAYRNRVDDVRALAAPVLERAARRGRPVIVAIETTCVEPPQVTFCGQTHAQLAEALAHLASSLRASPSFAGLAVHSYPGWSRLDGEVR